MPNNWNGSSVMNPKSESWHWVIVVTIMLALVILINDFHCIIENCTLKIARLLYCVLKKACQKACQKRRQKGGKKAAKSLFLNLSCCCLETSLKPFLFFKVSWLAWTRWSHQSFRSATRSQFYQHFMRTSFFCRKVFFSTLFHLQFGFVICCQKIIGKAEKSW